MIFREAKIAAALYGGLSLLLSPTFPFSTFPMYADIHGRNEAVVPAAWVHGERVDLFDYTDFNALDPQRIDLRSMPCSLGYLVEEMRWHVRDHTAQHAGNIKIEVGYIPLRVTPQGIVSDAPVILTRGTAKSRDL